MAASGPDTSPPDGGANARDAESVTPLEQEVLDEYTRLLGNMNKLASSLSTLADLPSAEILDGLRALERKTSLVFTLLKASVYSIVLQQEIYSGEDGAGAAGDGRSEGTRSELGAISEGE